ncbi:MAG: ATPase, T2SS/T4P/T4SS family [Candidatus Thermoplasmatota archaeon]|nr:ATPase, T2SS/T4P/T4SS family [Candidatus Thermoplasmatota archaeon]
MAAFGDHPPLPDSLETILSDETTSTVFLKADCPPRAKRGHISELRLDTIDDKPWTKMEVSDLSKELATVVDQHPDRSDCFVEIEREGCRILQIGDLRVTCAWPPFSDAWEITVVRPVAYLSLSDYEIEPELRRRLSDHHRGVFVVGKPGSGKTTFAQAIAAYLDDEVGAMVKTMEAPRDLQLPDRITQYAPLEGDLEKTAEVIFLVRPDFVIFDEVRRSRDFEIFGDVRLAGVGLLGVTHANSALEAIQRLVGKVELGLISQVLDTVIHIEKGKVHEILELKMVVRAPTGMESDLSRPVIEIRRFPSGELTHEMFAFGSEIAVVPVGGEDGRGSPAMAMAGDELKRQVIRITGISVAFAKFMTDASAEIYVDESAVGAVVGPGGQNIRRIEQQLGVKLDVKSVRELPRNQRKRLNSRQDDIQDMSEWKTRSGREWQGGDQGGSRRGKRRKGRGGRR